MTVRTVAAIAADFVQPFGRDGEAEELVLELVEHFRQAHALEVLGYQRIVGSLDAVLDRKVEAGRGLAAAGDANQDHVGLV